MWNNGLITDYYLFLQPFHLCGNGVYYTYNTVVAHYVVSALIWRACDVFLHSYFYYML